MFYQVRANLLFTTADQAKTFFKSAKSALAKSSIINPGAPNVEFSIIERINNNHDQDPNQPCELVESADNK